VASSDPDRHRDRRGPVPRDRARPSDLHGGRGTAGVGRDDRSGEPRRWPSGGDRQRGELHPFHAEGGHGLPRGGSRRDGSPGGIVGHDLRQVALVCDLQPRRVAGGCP